eukprot:COSAG02_NODE_1812_length_10792_cov_36.615205_8_plen_292_part_00
MAGSHPTTGSDAKLFHTQADIEGRKLTERRVDKLRKMYWFGVLFLLTHVLPGMLVGGYGIAKSKEYDGVMCMEIDDQGVFVPIYEPSGVVTNLYLVGFFWVAGATFSFFFAYTTLVWFERLEQVNQQPKLKGKVVSSFREFGTAGVMCSCYIFCAAISSYVMLVLTMMVLSANIGAASDFCAVDEGMGGEMYSAAKFVNGMAWLFSFVTGGEVGLAIFYRGTRRKKKISPPGMGVAGGPSSDAGSDLSEPDPNDTGLDTQSINDEGDLPMSASLAVLSGARGGSARGRAAP